MQPKNAYTGWKRHGSTSLTMTLLIPLTMTLLGLLLLTGTTAFAQAPMSLIPDSGVLVVPNAPDCNFTTGALHFYCIPIYIGYLIRFLLGMAGGLFLFGIMIAGYKYMFGGITAAGLESGKKEIIGRIIGLVIVVFSYLLVDTILRLLT